MASQDIFTKAYIEAALWSSCDDTGEPLDKHYGPEDLAPETLAKMLKDCAEFQEAASEDLHDPAQDGHDFWLTRNRHGTGFWDRGYGPRGDWLTEIAHAWGSVELYVGNDGRIYA